MILILWFVSFFAIGWWISDLYFETKYNFMKRKLAQTSIDAGKSMTYDIRKGHHQKIVNALKSLGEGNYCRIADIAGFKDKVAVARRLKEMENENIIIKTDRKSNTSSGRKAFNYTLCIKGDVVEKKGEAKEKQPLSNVSAQYNLF